MSRGFGVRKSARGASCRTLWWRGALLAALMLVLPWQSVNGQGRPEIDWLAGGHHYPLSKVVVDPDGEFIATTCKHGPVYIWSLADNRLIRTLRTNHAIDNQRALAISNDGQILATPTRDNHIDLWRVSDWTRQRTIATPTLAQVLVFSADDQYLVAGHSDGIRFWRVADGVMERHIPASFGVYLVGIDISPDGQYVATAWSWGGPECMSLWTVSNGARQNLVPPSGTVQGGLSVKFSHGGQLLATTGNEFDHNPKVHLWAIPGGQFVRSTTSWYDSGLGGPAIFSPDDQRVLAVGFRLGHWEVSSGTYLGGSDLTPGDAWSLVYAPNGEVITAGHELHRYRGSDIFYLGRFPAHRTGLSGLAISNDGQTVISCGHGSGQFVTPEIKVWRASDGELIRTIQGFPHWMTVYAMDLSPDGETVVTGETAAIRAWDLPAGAQSYSIGSPHGQAVRAVAISPAGDVFASGGKDGRLKIWRLSDGALLIDNYASPEISAVEFSPDGQIVASACDRYINQITLWEVSTGSVLRTVSTVGYVKGMAFSPDGGVLLLAGIRDWDGSNGIEALDVASGVRLMWSGTSLPAYDVSVSPDGQTAASVHVGSIFNEVKIWRMADLALLQTYDDETGWGGPPTVIEYHPDGLSFTYGRRDAVIVTARNPYPPVGDVAGIVSADGAPLAGVTVTVSGIGGHSQSDLTAADGSYQFSGVPAGTATVTIDIPAGYVAVDPATGSADLMVTAGQTSTQDFVLAGVGTLAGLVTGDGMPLAGVMVSVTADGYSQSMPTAGDGTYAFNDVPHGSATVSIVVPSGYEAVDPAGGSATVQVIGGQSTVQDFFLVGFGSLAGSVLANCPQPNTGLFGVTIDAFEAGTGDLLANTVTDENGYFEMVDVLTGDYVLTIVTPLGYDATPDEISITVVVGETSTADFFLSCVPIVAEPRTIGFWKHQVGVALGGHGNAQLDGPTLCGLLDDIEAHFNNSPLNPVVVYVPPASGECMDKLEVAKQLLNLRGNVHMSARAKQQLTALLLNVVVGYVDQAGVISGDGRTVSQAITYCDELIDTGADYERAKTIADLINNNQPVPDGWIPMDTPNYTYSLPLVRQVPKGHFMVAPNPGLLARTFSFGLGSKGWVTLDIYDAAGRLLATPFSGELDPGPQAIRWDGLSARGASLGHGQYFARLTTPAGQQTIKLLVLNP